MSWTGARAAALVAALVLAALSRGDVIVLAALLVAGTWRPLPAGAVVAALASTAWRWGSSSLGHIAGAQSVLGPAGFVDPPASAVAAWMAGAAILLATADLGRVHAADAVERHDAGSSPRGGLGALGERIDLADPRLGRSSLLAAPWLSRLASAAAAMVVVAGPGSGDVWVRVPATVVALVVAAALDRLSPLRRWRHPLAAALGVGSLVAVALEAPSLEGLMDGGAFLEGAVVAVAVGGLVWVSATAIRHALVHRR